MDLNSFVVADNTAYDRYIERFKSDASNTIILFVVQDAETNKVDQRLLEFHWGTSYCEATTFPI